MTAVTKNWVPAGDTGEKLYACTKVMSDALTEVGLLKTSDTGQINLSTVTTIAPPNTAPADTPTEYGYEMRQLVATGKPTVYIRVSYCVVATTANSKPTYRVAVFFRAGTGTTGSGALSGSVMEYSFNQYASGSGLDMYTSMTAQRPLYVASDGQHYLTVVNDPTGSANPYYKHSYMSFFCERTVDYLSGAYDSGGLIGSNCGANSYGPCAFQLLNLTSGAVYSSLDTPYQVPGSIFKGSGSLSTATIMPLAVVTPTPKGPAIGSVLAYSADTTVGGQYDIAMYGVTRRYIDIGGLYAVRWPYLQAFDSRPLVRFD